MITSHLPLPAALAAAALSMMLFAAPTHAAGRIEVNWVEPQQFSDVGRSPTDREAALRTLTEHMNKLAQRLPDGQTLKLTVTDLNLAGELEPWRAQEVRVLRGRADWPTMSLRYELISPGNPLRSGEAQLADMNYAFSSLRRPGEDLGYEKRMIDAWFQAEFLSP